MPKILLLLILLGATLISGCDSTGEGDREAIARDWVERYEERLNEEILDEIVKVDFGYQMGNELIRRMINDDVARQVSSGLEWSYEPSSSNSDKITATASITVEIQTKTLSSMGGLIKAPALEGRITASVPYKLTILKMGEIIQWGMSRSDVIITLDVAPR